MIPGNGRHDNGGTAGSGLAGAGWHFGCVHTNASRPNFTARAGPLFLLLLPPLAQRQKGSHARIRGVRHATAKMEVEQVLISGCPDEIVTIHNGFFSVYYRFTAWVVLLCTVSGRMGISVLWAVFPYSPGFAQPRRACNRNGKPLICRTKVTIAVRQ